MPTQLGNKVAVTKDELIPKWFNTENTLYSTLDRYKKKEYGIKRMQRGGGGHQLLIDFDTLPRQIQEDLGDPRKLDNPLEMFYKTDPDAVRFFADYRFSDGTALNMTYQEKYIINASVIRAVLALRDARIAERKRMNGSMKGLLTSLQEDAKNFNETLRVKHKVQHTLPSDEKRFKEYLNKFSVVGYECLISGKHKNDNSRKVTDPVEQLLNDMFYSESYKPTSVEIYRKYNSFIHGFTDVINNETGELYDPSKFEKLSEATVSKYLYKWKNAIATFQVRGGDRQKNMGNFRPYHSFEQPKFAGSIISVDDRQPPFEYADGERPWFYMGIDLASEAFTVWVHGKSKKGIILEFYRQMVRNYHEWGFRLPAELEAELSLNSMFKDSFLKEGVMFEYIHIEANNARAKRIESFFKKLRYGKEKSRTGWIPRPFAKTEANQPGPEKVPIVRYDSIIEGCKDDIIWWNNFPHSSYPEAIKDILDLGITDKPYKSRWQVFCETQNPDLLPTNYQLLLRHLGYRTQTSVRLGIIQLQEQEYLLGDEGAIATGDRLISLMDQVEGKAVEVYWLEDNQGEMLKAYVYAGTQYICEAVSKPKYNRARKERTEQDRYNESLMSSYETTITAYGNERKRSLEKVVIISNAPMLRQDFNMPDVKQRNYDMNELTDTLPDTEEEEMVPVQTSSYRKPLSERF